MKVMRTEMQRLQFRHANAIDVLYRSDGIVSKEDGYQFGVHRLVYFLQNERHFVIVCIWR